MSVVIQLDGSALDRLFPEGSTARVELTAAVVNNMVDRLSIKKLKELPETLQLRLNAMLKSADQECERQVEKALTDAGLIKRNWSDIELTDKLRTRIKSEAEAIAGDLVRRTAQAATSEQAVKDNIEFRIGRMLDGELRKHLEEMVAAAIRAKFS